MQVGKLNPLGKLNFPGFQKILDFTATGSESSVSVSVNGDTDKEYKIDIRNLNSSVEILTQLNSDTTASNYGYQTLQNSAGTITSGRSAGGVGATITYTRGLTKSLITLLTPTGFIKTSFCDEATYSSGTTISGFFLWGMSWNNTANVTNITFKPASGNFTSGTRITVYARRSNV